ncbi:MAG: DUF393 domain-containing protein [Rhodospirillaceae bacterium]|nr:DUF393 domain-containing protein [Rhodospirillaceae bacterium]|tara:strand:+ start:1402 stop:1845 length:444 start_codon:yes stop_codon:yes gene_type:complete
MVTQPVEPNKTIRTVVRSKKTTRPAVFFDGDCPLCAAEISAYRNCRGGDEIDWVDVSRRHVAADENIDWVAPGLSRYDALRRFHMRRADGTIVSGGAAFAELWVSLPAWSKIGRMAKRWPLRTLTEAAYRIFLSLRPGLQWILRKIK